MSEKDEQTALFKWMSFWASRHPELDLAFHVPNGGLRSKATAANFKRMGVKRGVPDIMLPVARNGYHGLFIELKAGKGVLSQYQKTYIQKLGEQGYSAVVCKGWEEASKTISDYLGFEIL